MTDEDIEFLNQVDTGYIGLTKPKVEHAKDPGLSIPIQQALEEDGDYLPIDLQGLE